MPMNAGNVFTPMGALFLGEKNTVAAKDTASEVTPEKIDTKWFESPLMFITVIVALLATIHIVERKFF